MVIHSNFSSGSSTKYTVSKQANRCLTPISVSFAVCTKMNLKIKLVSFRIPEVFLYAFLVAFGVASVDAKAELSQCLTEPLKGLVYRYTGAVDGMPEVKTGCYAMYGDGTLDYDQMPYPPEPIQQRQFFVIDATASEIPLSSDGYINATILGRGQSATGAELQMRTFKPDELCFPQICYDSWDEYSRCCLIPFLNCGTTTMISRTHLGKVKEYESELFCSTSGSGVLGEKLAFQPHDAGITVSGKVPNDSEPYVRYFYGAIAPGGMHLGCDIFRPLTSDSDTAFRNFYYLDNGEKISVNSDGTLPNKSKDNNFRMTSTMIKKYCFPENCFISGEDQHCVSSKTARAYSETAYGILLHVGNREPTRLLGRIRCNQCN